MSEDTSTRSRPNGGHLLQQLRHNSAPASNLGACELGNLNILQKLANECYSEAVFMFCDTHRFRRYPLGRQPFLNFPESLCEGRLHLSGMFQLLYCDPTLADCSCLLLQTWDTFGLALSYLKVAKNTQRAQWFRCAKAFRSLCPTASCLSF